MKCSTLLRRGGVLALVLASSGRGTRLDGQTDTPLTLAEVYALARSQNPMLRAARSAAQALASQEGSARLPPDPQLQLGVMNASLPGLELDMPNAMAPALQLMQMLPFPGKLSLGGEVARLETAKAERQAEESWWEVRARAAMAFYEVYEAEQRTVVMRETLGLLQDFRRVAHALYSAGEGRQSDVLRASVEVARMEAELERMYAMRAAAASRLNAVLGRPADTPVPPTVAPPLPDALPPRDTLRAWAEADRPMLARGRTQVEQARTRRELARLELWPDLSVGVQYGQRPGEMGTERMGSLMVGFSLPVFARQRQVQMRLEAQAMELMARAELDDMTVQVDARIGELIAELTRASSLIDLYRTVVLPQAGVTVSSAMSGYRIGAVDFMTLLDAQMTVNQYREELHTLLAERGRLFSELEMTVGREILTPNPLVVQVP